MNRIRVDSAIVASMGYDVMANVVEVEFHDGSIYQYKDVPQSVYVNLLDAEPPEHYLDQNIRGIYPDSKLELD